MDQITPEIEEAIHKFIVLIQKKTRILKVFLYAKGTEAEWSDIDLAVVSPDFSDDLFRPGDFTEDDPLVREIRRSGVEIQIKD